MLVHYLPQLVPLRYIVFPSNRLLVLARFEPCYQTRSFPSVEARHEDKTLLPLPAYLSISKGLRLCAPIFGKRG